MLEVKPKQSYRQIQVIDRADALADIPRFRQDVQTRIARGSGDFNPMEAWKLTRRQYRQLQHIWERLPDPTETFSATKAFTMNLSNSCLIFGFSPVDSFDAVSVSEELLTTPPREE